MSINKAQGQTLKCVGIYLKDDVFGHGQLYVALSRSGSFESIFVIDPAQEPTITGGLMVKNVVYKEALLPQQ